MPGVPIVLPEFKPKLYIMLIKTYGSSVHGIKAITITIEVNVSQGIRFIIVGLADSAVRESQQRIHSAITNNGFEWPWYRVVINMAPADIRKEGTAYDLPLALGILAASSQLSGSILEEYVITGESVTRWDSPSGKRGIADGSSG